MTAAAIVMAVLLVVIAAFQLALALGAPLGAAAWGGQHLGVLPLRLRVASGLAGVLVYPIMILYVLGSATLIDTSRLPIGRAGMWILTGFFALGAAANLASRSRVERIWGPVSLVLAVCAVIIALGM
ncbi:MAG TPA: hypothetical protein VJR05_11045 [Acidimicrobiia bacterium]|nr:hypothetical protein [Acidimicrobiia bacterium]